MGISFQKIPSSTKPPSRVGLAAHNSMPQRGPREGPARDSASHLRRIRRPRAAQMQPATLRIFGDTSAAPGPLYALGQRRCASFRRYTTHRSPQHVISFSHQVKNTLKSLSRALKTASPRPQVTQLRPPPVLPPRTRASDSGAEAEQRARPPASLLNANSRIDNLCLQQTPGWLWGPFWLF